MEKFLILRAERILTVSQSSKSQIHGLVGLNIPIDIINPGFEKPKEVFCTSRSKIPPFQMLYVGAITQAKGVIDLVRATKLLPSDPRWDLHLVGKTDAEPVTVDRVKQEIGLLRGSNKIILHGWLSDEKLKQLYQVSEIFILPSYWEGYGIVLLEAMSHGLVPVASCRGAIPEIIEHELSGLLFAAGNVEELADALKRLLNDPMTRKRLSQAAQLKIRGHADWIETEGKFRVWWRTVGLPTI